MTTSMNHLPSGEIYQLGVFTWLCRSLDRIATEVGPNSIDLRGKNGASGMGDACSPSDSPDAVDGGFVI
jgi:hypothetical protein